MSHPGRYTFVPLGGAGLLLDLDSGFVFRLNDSAALVWSLKLAGRADSEIAGALASRYALDQHQASIDVAAALHTVDATAPQEIPTGDFLYQRSQRGYLQSFRGRPVLEVDDRGERLQALKPTSEDPLQIHNCVRAMAPKVLSLRGHVTLHASAVAIRDRLVAFLGPSGAGKTTTARALVKNGARAICEDKLIVNVGDGRVVAWVTAERSVDHWVTEATSSLSATGHASCALLDEVATGEQLPLAELGFIDAGRRQVGRLTAVPLDNFDAAKDLFRCTFLGSDAPLNWNRLLKTTASLATLVPSYELTMPSTLSGLDTHAVEIIRKETLAP